MLIQVYLEILANFPNGISGVKYMKFNVRISIFVMAGSEMERNAFEMTAITVEKRTPVANLAKTRGVLLWWIILLCCCITDCTLIVV